MEIDMDEIRRKVKEFLELNERARKGIKEWEKETKRLKRENRELRKRLEADKKTEKRK